MVDLRSMLPGILPLELYGTQKKIIITYICTYIYIFLTWYD